MQFRFSLLGIWKIAFGDHKNISYLQHTSLYGLHVISQARRTNNDASIGELGYLHL